MSEFPFHIYSTHCYNLHTKNSEKNPNIDQIMKKRNIGEINLR